MFVPESIEVHHHTIGVYTMSPWYEEAFWHVNREYVCDVPEIGLCIYEA